MLPRIILYTLVCIRHCTPDVASQTIECLSAYRLCYYTSASTNRKSDFVKELSASYKLACLTCSFSDEELGEYFQHKKRRAGSIPLKYAVSHVGLQEDGTWVLGSSTYFKFSGEETLEGSHQSG